MDRRRRESPTVLKYLNPYYLIKMLFWLVSGTIVVVFIGFLAAILAALLITGVMAAVLLLASLFHGVL